MVEPGGFGANYRDSEQGFGNVRLPIIREGDRSKAKDEALREKLFEHWIIQNPRN